MTNGPGRIELGRILAGENHAPAVYFARIADKVKIGTTTNLKQRMRSFYLDLSDVLVVVPGGKDVEAAYHKRFGSSRADEDGRQELFHIDHRLAFFLGLWRQSPRSVKRPGLPLGLMPRREVGNFLDLDDELRHIEGGGSGHWYAGTVEKAADIVARMTYLCVTARKKARIHRTVLVISVTKARCTPTTGMRPMNRPSQSGRSAAALLSGTRSTCRAVVVEDRARQLAA